MGEFHYKSKFPGGKISTGQIDGILEQEMTGARRRTQEGKLAINMATMKEKSELNP